MLSFAKALAKQGYKGVVVEEMARLNGLRVEKLVVAAMSEGDVLGLPRM